MLEIDLVKKILFICTDNSSSSQMAEALLRDLCGGYFECHSAGMRTSPLSPDAVKVMSEIGINISKQRTKSILDHVTSNTAFAFVIKLSDDVNRQKRSWTPQGSKHLEWNLPDPCGFGGTNDEKLQSTRELRDAIKLLLACWCVEACG